MSALFWFVLTLAGLAWYAVVLIYVAIKGAAEIRKILSSMRKQQSQQTGD